MWPKIASYMCKLLADIYVYIYIHVCIYIYIRVRGLRPHGILLPWEWCLDLGKNGMFFFSFSGAGVWSFYIEVVRRGPGAHVTLVRELFAGLL